MAASSKEIIRMCKKNEKAGYDLLFEKYKNYVYSICYHYTNSKEDALDLMQEIYLKIFKAIGSFEEDKPILPWIKKITSNTCLNFLRQHKSTQVSLNESIDAGEGSLEGVLASDNSIEEEILYLDTKKELESAIKELPKEMRMVVILRYLKDMNYNEIATVMSCPLGTVKTYLFRGRQLLKDKLKAKGILGV